MSAQVVELTHKESGAAARVLVSQGFNCFSWKASTPDGGVCEMLYAPDDFDQGQQRPSSAGTPLLFPFPGRIAAGRFSFQGKEYAVPEGDGQGNALHGFAFDRAWRVVDQSATHVTGEFRGSVDAPETLELWPSDYAIRVTYRLEAARLVCEVKYENPGDGDLPCGFGTHAYFRMPLDGQGDAADTVLMVPLSTQCGMDGMIPTGQLEATDLTRELTAGLTLGQQQFDTVFLKLEEAQGDVATSIASGALKITQTCGDEFGCYVIYTPPHREGVCIEPYTCVPDPFGLEEKGVASGLTILSPGESREHTLTLEVGKA